MKEFNTKNKASLLTTHPWLLAGGAFETMRSYNGRIFRLDEHLERLYASCKTLSINLNEKPRGIKSLIKKEFAASKLKDASIRLSIDLDKKIDVIVKKINKYPEEYYKNGVKIATVAVRRNISVALEPRIKSSDFLWGVMAKLEPNKEGIFEQLILNHDGFLSECTVSNIFIVKNNILFTPALSSGILSGITRQFVINLSDRLRIDTKETLLTRHDLYNADEVFLTNTSIEIMPVVEADKRIIGTGKPGKTTKQLLKMFREETKSNG